MLELAQTVTATPHSTWLDTFKLIATILGVVSAVIGISVFSSKVFRFINAVTDFVTIAAPKTVVSIEKMESCLNTAVYNHLDHIQTSSQATLIATNNLAAELCRLREDFHARELDAARAHGELMAMVKGNGE